MTRRKVVFGRFLMVMGVVSTVVFLSPIFPIGVEALLVGGIFFAAAAWVQRPPEFDAWLRGAGRLKLRPRVSFDPLLPVEVLRLASRRQGVLTTADVAMALNVPLDQAQAALQDCVRSGHAVEDFDDARGTSRFKFLQFVPPDDLPLREH
jgi:hypothetical protein